MLCLRNVRRLVLTASSVALLLLCTGVARAESLFNGAYAVGNWTTTLTNSDGGVDKTGAPTSVTLTGGNNRSGQPGETLFSITAPTATTLTFDWTYTTYDSAGSYFDPGGFEINSAKTQLSPYISVAGYSGSGVTTVSLNAGDEFGFYVDTFDNLLGPATLKVSGVPEPSCLTLLGAGVLGLAGLFRRGFRQLGR